MNKKRIFIDFDGTICPTGVCDDEPLPGCVETINELVDNGDKVTIFSCRANEEICSKKMVQEMTYYLTRHGIRYTDIYYGKPLYDVLIDDRAVGFIPDWSVIKKQIENSK